MLQHSRRRHPSPRRTHRLVHARALLLAVGGCTSLMCGASSPPIRCGGRCCRDRVACSPHRRFSLASTKATAPIIDRPQLETPSKGRRRHLRYVVRVRSENSVHRRDWHFARLRYSGLRSRTSALFMHENATSVCPLSDPTRTTLASAVKHNNGAAPRCWLSGSTSVGHRDTETAVKIKWGVPSITGRRSRRRGLVAGFT